jgi:hypothetical protein
MAEQTFRSPGFFEREIDLSAREAQPTGTPAGVIGSAESGPAFIPVTVATMTDFVERFGKLDPNRAGPYAVSEYLKHKDAVTFLRVLGAGSNDTEAEMTATRTYGIVSKAGLQLSGTDVGLAGAIKTLGVPQFLCAQHFLSTSIEALGFPEFSDNNSFPDAASNNYVNLLRGVIFPTTGSKIVVMHGDKPATAALIKDTDGPIRVGTTGGAMNKMFKIIVSSSAGAAWSNDDDCAGARIYTASLNPMSDNYIAKVLNTDPTKFQTEQHLLYLDFAVEDEIAPIRDNYGVIGPSFLSPSGSVCIMSGSRIVNAVGGQSQGYGDTFGRYDTRYTTPQTPKIISQPFGATEYDLFHFESISDGAYASDKYKISIANLRASTDDNYPYGTFEVQLRLATDTDEAKEVLETFPNLNLDPNSDRFIARIVGDYKPKYNFDSLDLDEQRIVVTGKYPNMSRYVRVVIPEALYNGELPKEAIPFGFRGIPVLKLTDSLTDQLDAALSNRDGTALGDAVATIGQSNRRLAWITGSLSLTKDRDAGPLTGQIPGGGLSGSIVPPLPLRFKVTKGNAGNQAAYVGYPSAVERTDSRLYWGAKFERCANVADVATPGLNPNAGSLPNACVAAYSKFQGLAKIDALVTGSGADHFNDNKFTLARVALSNQTMAQLTGSATECMREAAYMRSLYPSAVDGRITDPSSGGYTRFTMATLVASSSVKFNRFTNFNKFTMPFFGGWDGLNILDRDIVNMTDRAASTDPGGYGGDSITGGLGLAGTSDGVMMGKARQNNVIFSYRKAADIMTDPLTVSTNLLAIPGLRDPFVTDHALVGIKAYSMAMYVMDSQHYDEDGNRLYSDDSARPDVRETVEQFEGRRVDSNFAATYFPDVFIEDTSNNRPVFVPSSVAAYGALSYSDSVSYPWFAPAGFNRASLGFVTNTEVRLTSGDRDDLYDARINPIANFPNGGFVIFGQKTLQMNKSSLDRVNVRRMLLEVKRLVVNVAEQLLFEPNNTNTRARFVNGVQPILALIQSQAGIESFNVVMDNSNNTQEDVEQNRLNGRIVVVPTRAIEFIAIDFIVTNSGVEFA